MRKEEIIEILNDWNFWKKEMESGTIRDSYVANCLRFLKTNVITAVIGARRAGKSYILRQTIKELIKSRIKKKNILMINFEDRRFMEFNPKLLDQIYETYLEFLKPDKTPFVFLDEIQNIPEWERWARTMHELGKAKIIVSGSSSKLLSGEFATVLTGRHLDVIVFPLSFKEFLNFKNLEIKDKLDIAAKREEIKRFLREYMENGGFPEVSSAEDKKQLLLAYFDDMLTKDIEKRYKLKEGGKLRALTKFYLTNISSTITFNSLKKMLDTTTTTVEKFSSYLEEINLIVFVKRFSFKTKEQEKSPRKVYSIDNGMANAIGFKFSANNGKIAENIIAIELKKKLAQNPDIELYYWKNPLHEEVDFVVKEATAIKQLIQACWNIDNYKAKEREIKALLKASKELKCNNLLVITEDKEGEEKIKGKTIKYIPLWKWLLEAN